MSDSNKQPEPPPKAPPSALSIVCATLAVILSSAIAFFVTCIPVGFMAYEIGGGMIVDGPSPEQSARNNLLFFIACVIGTCAALLVGYMVYRAFRKHWRKQ